jgi:hypothetical protein
MKKITLIILFILIQFSLLEVYGADEDLKLIGGFEKIEYKYGNKGWVELLSKEMTELYKNILEKLTNGVPFNNELKEIIIDTLNAGINYELGKLKNCMEGYYSEKIKDKEKKGKIDLKFDGNKRDGSHIKSKSSEKITLSGRHLEEIISDISSSLKNKKDWFPDNIYTLPWYKDFLTDLGHEMIHSHAGISGGHHGECIAHCLTRNCINSEHDPRDFFYSTGYMGLSTKQLECNTLKFSSDIKDKMKMGEGKCFCGVNWENRSDNDPCEEEEKPPPDEDEEEDRNGGGKGPNVGRDTPDDNFSHASGHDGFTSLMASLSAFPLNLNTDQDFFSYSYYPDILIYNKFDTGAMEHLLDRFMPGNYINDSIHDHFSNKHRLLIVPAGEIMGDQDSEIIQNAFENFVACGGVLLFLTQQYNSQITNFLNFESKETLKTFGFRQDQSCYLKSTYFQEMHPGLSSSNDEAITFSIDGYAKIPGAPSDVNVLLYRTKNRQAAILYFPHKRQLDMRVIDFFLEISV